MIPKILFGTVAFIAVSGAQAEAPDTAPDWSSDRFLVGKWSCDQTRPGHRTAHEEVVYSMGLGGRWLQLTYTLASPEPGVPDRTTVAYESFDSSLARWVYISIGSDGDYGLSYSDGWKGNTKRYGPAAGSPQTWRLIAVKLSNDEFTEDIDLASKDGRWSRTVSLRCRRNP
jgi:hypothetical protein